MKSFKNHELFNEIKIYENIEISDQRGLFRKPFFNLSENENFKTVEEVIVTTTKKNYFRGLHFQLPPKDMDKMVTCIEGEILDFFVDLRKSSNNYGKLGTYHLSEKKGESILIPKGFAHGLTSLSEKSTILYVQSEQYDLSYDSGVSIKSFPEQLENLGNLKLSEKDDNLPLLSNFSSPW
ncbi:MAG: dTDP-4-dehydrorhamnose 3,5-epimerase [Gammaproteobacteria bacterium]|nr:dTDP-4-dehydrorhamnose 3,5-epimerase [Gammaproteobacteria bacterium]|tara:strand:+ start:177 stop:716 length:540 start_codon:yes stop_codon:yes gene_type:complete